MRVVMIIIVLFFISFLAGCTTTGSARPNLKFDATVAADFRALANETWTEFLSTFAARSDCFGNVTLQTDRTLESRALYDPKTATVTVRVPGTPAFLQAALVHEWAHHVEFQCDAHQSLRPRLLALLDLPADTPWRTDTAWADTPSEQYAEAVVELVLGEHPLPTKIRVVPEVVREIERWVELK